MRKCVNLSGVAMIKISKGLNLPLSGNVENKTILQGNKVTKVALVASDYPGMKPTMLVKVGDQVKIGQKLFEDKKTPGVFFTSPGAGKVVEINRGARRAFQSVVIELDSNEEYQNFSNDPKSNLKAALIESGLWTSFRTRPFSKVPAIDSTPYSLFVNLMDTNPLSIDPSLVIEQDKESFKSGLNAITSLTNGKTYVCKTAGANIDLGSASVEVKEFSGVHPAGNSGTHIHFIDPVGPKKTVWTINYQDVIAIGKFIETSKLPTEKIISLAGPMASSPKYIKTRVGACTCDITKNETKEGDVRVVSGSAVHGTLATSPFCYLGKYHNQITLLEEGRKREFLGWHSAGVNKFSTKRIYLSKLMPNKLFNLTTTTHGSPRAMVPIGMYEKVMPLDILPTQLLRSLLTKDTDQAQALGCLELDEEDLALCTFVDPGKVDYGPVLRNNLEIIEKEG